MSETFIVISNPPDTVTMQPHFRKNSLFLWNFFKNMEQIYQIYVVHQRDRLFSCQLCGAYAPRFPPAGEGMC